MDSKILLGIVAVTIFGTLAAQSVMVEAGMAPLEIISVLGNPAIADPFSGQDVSTATCPATHQVIGGGLDIMEIFPAEFVAYVYEETVDASSNTFSILLLNDGVLPIPFTVYASCAKINLPMNMGMIGGELLEINTISLLVGAIGVNPVITGLVAITMGGVAVQAVWFVHQRKKKNS